MTLGNFINRLFGRDRADKPVVPRRISLEERCREIEALGEQPGADAIEKLASILREPYLDLRLAAVKALGKIRSTEATGLLAFAARTKVSMDWAEGELRQGKDTKKLMLQLGISMFFKAATEEDNRKRLRVEARRRDESVSQAAISALQLLGAAGVGQLFELYATENDRPAKLRLAEALGMAGDIRVLGDLIDALRGGSNTGGLLEAIAAIGSTSVDPLLDCLSPDCRAAPTAEIISLLGRIGEPRTLPALVLQAQNEQTGQVAVTAMVQILETRASMADERDLKAIANLSRVTQREYFQPFYYEGEEAAPGKESRMVDLDTSRLRELADTELQLRRKGGN